MGLGVGDLLVSTAAIKALMKFQESFLDKTAFILKLYAGKVSLLI